MFKKLFTLRFRKREPQDLQEVLDNLSEIQRQLKTIQARMHQQTDQQTYIEEPKSEGK